MESSRSVFHVCLGSSVLTGFELLPEFSIELLAAGRNFLPRTAFEIDIIAVTAMAIVSS